MQAYSHFFVFEVRPRRKTEGRRITHLVQAVRSDGVGQEVGTTMGTPPAASRPKAGLPKDGVGDGDRDGAMSREVAEVPREAASMARHRGRENWAA
jgi:hypothetical protein